MPEYSSSYYASSIDTRDLDSDPALVEVTVSPEDFGSDIKMQVTTWETTITTRLTAEQAHLLVTMLTTAIRHTT